MLKIAHYTTGCYGTSAASTIISDTTLSATNAPTITTQPVAQSVTAGQTATFSVVANGIPAPSYQWYMNSAAISGATASSYTTPATTSANNGETFYVIVANSAGSVTSSTVTLTVNASTGDVIAIAAGGPAESDASGGDANFVADEYFSGGGDNSHTSHTINLTQPGANAAPMGVYQYGRVGITTYTIPGLVADSQYSVLLHFSENYFTAAGKRVFNVAINGTTVLSDFDIYKTAGAEYTAVVESFVATANSSGEIVIAFTDGTANQPLIDGIEIRGGAASTCTAVTSAPTGLAVTATTSSSVSLSWTAPAPPIGCTVSSYVVNDGTATPPTTVAASGVAGTTYTVSGLAASTTYYFSVAAVDSFGTSAASTPVSDTTSTVTNAPTITTQPVAQSVTAGQTATFSVVATGSPAPTYQWYMNSAAISGATAATYTTPATTTANSGESFYVIVTNSAGSVTSNTVTLTVNASTGDFIAIAAGGPAESDANGGDANFVADEYFSGGGKATHTTQTINLTQPGANAAPMAVYQYGHTGTTTYTIPGMAANSSHTVLLHFSENYFSAAGDRVFNVAINGTSVLSDFDIFATAGAKYTAVEKTFTTTANSSGDIVIAFTNGTANQPVIDGIEIR